MIYVPDIAIDIIPDESTPYLARIKHGEFPPPPFPPGCLQGVLGACNVYGRTTAFNLRELPPPPPAPPLVVLLSLLVFALAVAVQVTYCATGFLEKNNDTLQEDLRGLLLSSSIPFLRQVRVPHQLVSNSCTLKYARAHAGKKACALSPPVHTSFFLSRRTSCKKSILREVSFERARQAAKRKS